MIHSSGVRRQTPPMLQAAGVRRPTSNVFTAAKLRRAPLRIATGGFILNSAMGKRGGDEKTAASLHGMASRAYPVLAKAEPQPFRRILAAGELIVATALLLPIVPARIAGLALIGFLDLCSRCMRGSLSCTTSICGQPRRGFPSLKTPGCWGWESALSSTRLTNDGVPGAPRFGGST
jgi:hypothetical protein